MTDHENFPILLSQSLIRPGVTEANKTAIEQAFRAEYEKLFGAQPHAGRYFVAPFGDVRKGSARLDGHNLAVLNLNYG